MIDIDLHVAREREILRAEADVLDRLKSFDREIAVRVLLRALVSLEQPTDDVAPAPGDARIGLTSAIVGVLSSVPGRQMTSRQIEAEIARTYKTDTKWILQALSRAQKRGGPILRVGKDPASRLWLYRLRD